MDTLLNKTLKMARQSNASISEVCRATGLKSRWFRRLLKGDYEDPGVNKIEKLYNFYSQQQEKKAA